MDMESRPVASEASTEMEGDYRPASSTAPLDPANTRIESVDYAFFMRLTDTLNTTLDLQTLLNHTAELVRSLFAYKIFAILLLNERTQDLRMRFQIGHS